MLFYKEVSIKDKNKDQDNRFFGKINGHFVTSGTQILTIKINKNEC